MLIARIAATLLSLSLLAGGAQAANATSSSVEFAQANGDSTKAPSTSRKQKEQEKTALDGRAEKSDRLKISGYIQFYFQTRKERSGDKTTEPSFFRFGRIKVRFAGKVKPRLSYVVEIDPRSPQIEGVVRDAYIQYEFHPHQSLRAGQMKTPFGWENRMSTFDLYTVKRTEVGESFGRGLTLRDSGIGWFGQIPLGNGSRLENELTVTNGAGLSAQADDDRHKNVFGRLGGRWKTKPAIWSLGISGATGSMNEPVDPSTPDQPGLSVRFSRFGVDMECDTRRVFVVVEYAQGNDKANLPDEGGVLSAYYVLAAGKTRWDVGPVFRYDEFDSDTNRWTAGGYYGAPGEDFRAIISYSVLDEPDLRHDGTFLIYTELRF